MGSSHGVAAFDPDEPSPKAPLPLVQCGIPERREMLTAAVSLCFMARVLQFHLARNPSDT